MQSSDFHNLPPFWWLLAAVLALVIFVVQFGILGYAYEKIGIQRRTAFLILVLSLVGSYINLPIGEIAPEQPTRFHVFLDPATGTARLEPLGTSVALNVGGAIVPTLISIYLLVKNSLYVQAIAGIAFVSAVVHWLAAIEPGMGVSVPIFAPPIVSAAVSMILARYHAAPLAYISGSLGTLIGADILNLAALVDTGPAVVSIGGAGTFDGVFLTGILAVLLAVSPRPVTDDEPPPNFA
jgi:uncharacterized membrane protein